MPAPIDPSPTDSSPIGPSVIDDALREELDALARRGLERAHVLDGRIPEHDFGSNDYLGLARDPRLVEALQQGVAHGVGGRSARLLGGGSPLHEQCERELAGWLGAEAALLFPSGYQANVGLVGALVGRGDAIVSDADNHASLIDGARLSRARIFVHRHVDLDDLERALRRAAGARRRLVLTESVFSMRGDAAPLAEIDALCRRHDAWLVVDEAHAIGLLGPEGAGGWAAAEIDGDHRLCARLVTAGKSLGVAGAFVAGSALMRRLLIHRARSFLFTTASPTPLAAALSRAIELCREADGDRARVLGHARTLARALRLPEPAAAIVPVPLGRAQAAVELAQSLRADGFYAPAVRPPTVAPERAGLRIVCHADQDEATITRLATLLREALTALPEASPEPSKLSSLTCVVGTDTGVGKTVVSGLLLRALQRLGPARYWKPVQTGDDDDTATVATLAGAEPATLLPNAAHYALPASPHEAAAAEGERVAFAELEAQLRDHRGREGRLLLEFAGGLLVPFDLEPVITQADWLARTDAQIALVARSGLGTLNHTMLTVEALRARNLHATALFLVGDVHDSNRETLRRMTGIENIYELPPLEPLNTAGLDDWLDQHSLDWLR